MPCSPWNREGVVSLGGRYISPQGPPVQFQDFLNCQLSPLMLCVAQFVEVLSNYCVAWENELHHTAVTILNFGNVRIIGHCLRCVYECHVYLHAPFNWNGFHYKYKLQVWVIVQNILLDVFASFDIFDIRCFSPTCALVLRRKCVNFWTHLFATFLGV